MFSCWLQLALSPSHVTAAPAGGRQPRIILDLPYPGAVKGERRRSLDLYLPVASSPKPPLFIFVHGGFWLATDDEYRIGVTVAETLVQEGVAVALVRYRLAPTHRHPAQAEDVAAAVAMLFRVAERYGYDSNRIFLAGHSAGGHLAALVALDARYLGSYQLSPRSLAGVIPLSGLYDLSPRRGISDNQKFATEQSFGTSPATLKNASPLSHVHAEAPPFLIFTSQSDFPGFLTDAKNFFDALYNSGHRKVDRWIITNRDHFTLMKLGDPTNDARLLLLDFLKVAPAPKAAAILVEAKRRWQEPPFSTLPLWRNKKLIRSHVVDPRFIARLIAIYTDLRYELLEWPLEKFYAMDLFAFIDALPPEKRGRGEYLITTNIRNEKQFWKRKEIEPYQPVLVIGLDGEKNLFRLGVFYRAHREYSWKDGPRPPLMARPLGAFIYFLKNPPEALRRQAAQYALTEDSFRLVEHDPLAKLRDLQNDIFETVTFRNGCIYCHRLRGIGSQSHHVVASTSERHGGHALALEAYPAEVWKNFIFDQEAVAKKIGASPNLVAEERRRALFDLVNSSRQTRQEKK